MARLPIEVFLFLGMGIIPLGWMKKALESDLASFENLPSLETQKNTYLTRLLFLKKSYHNHSDEDLMRLVAKGNELAFSELYDRYSGKMHSYFYKMLYQDVDLADDFTQELFLKVVEKPHLFDPERRFSTWIYTVAGNMCKNEYRKNSRHPMTNQIPEMANTECFEYLPDPIDRDFFEHQLKSAVNQLEDTHKQCFILRYQEGMSVKEISDIMEIPEGTVKSRLYYSMKKLAGKLQVFHPLQNGY